MTLDHSAFEFCLDRVPSPLGQLLVVCDDEGTLRALDFDDHEARMHRLLRLHYGEGGFTLTERSVSDSVVFAIQAFFGGRIDAFEGVKVKTGGTSFQKRVWAALRQIPAATTMTYGWLAMAIGQRTASRAVGLANGANPIAIAIPCHRVIGADGTLTGYGGGMHRKRWLLAHEVKHARAESTFALSAG